MTDDSTKQFCICCGKIEVEWPRICDNCIDHEAQAELVRRLNGEGEDPEEWRCKSCGAIYDGGQCCTYCGDRDPRGEHEYEDFDDDYLDEDYEDTCDGCGGKGCPLCCSHTYAAGSEQCEFCEYCDECAETLMEAVCFMPGDDDEDEVDDDG